MPDLDVSPGQLSELTVQGGLVAVDRQDPVHASSGQGGDVLALGVQGVRGDDRSGQVQAGHGGQQRAERGDLAGLRAHCGLAEHAPAVVVDHG